MNLKKTSILVLVISALLAPQTGRFDLLGCQVSHASEEGVLPLSMFYIKSEGIDGFGEIAVEGHKDPSMVYKKILVKAFGKLYKIDDAILRKIPAKFQNGIQLSCEKKTENATERAVYIMFIAGFTSGTKETFTIALFEDGAQNVIESL